ncbi:MAG: nitroreductase family protein [Bdellovibrionaceae bacterium]|nr:nitroreductase family protein [Pseudobdellovibrionaceae bacterium]
MEFFDVIQKRRSIRKFQENPFPKELVEKALAAAILAPNSSNTQTWDFHWPKNPQLHKKIVEACLSQSAARTASHLLVVTADPKNWRRSQAALINWVQEAKAPNMVVMYYKKLVPLTYSWGVLNFFAPIKFILSFVTGFFRPTLRGPYTRRDIQEVTIKSAALAAENFVLAITALGGATCMMEGFDEKRVKKALKLSGTTRVVMVIGIGYEGEKGTWGPQFRLPLENVVHIH